MSADCPFLRNFPSAIASDGVENMSLGTEISELYREMEISLE